MPTHDEFPHTLSGKAAEISKIVGGVSAACLAIGAIVFYVRFGDDWLEAQAQESLRLQKLAETVTEIQVDVTTLFESQQNQSTLIETIVRDLDVATRPNQIFEVNIPQSGARTPGCTEFQQCTIDLRVRRTIEGMRCIIVPGTERYYFVEDGTGARLQVNMISGTPSTQIGREWFDYHRTFELPSDLTEPVGFMYQATYTQCRGEGDNVEITQESPMIPIRVVRANAPSTEEPRE